ncbi:hypothetical protein [Streptacidiphilus sp. MAP5-3]|uniref:hypothetical protein n=1 Tax=unclassified Streptacidiphilus TaxID=2643834 RepID=UPI00351151D4
MNRRIAALLVGGMLSLAGLAAAPTTASADSADSGSSYPQTQKYVCNVNDSDTTAVVQTNDIAGASDSLPAFLPMQLSNCRPAS